MRIYACTHWPLYWKHQYTCLFIHAILQAEMSSWWERFEENGQTQASRKATVTQISGIYNCAEQKSNLEKTHTRTHAHHIKLWQFSYNSRRPHQDPRLSTKNGDLSLQWTPTHRNWIVKEKKKDQETFFQPSTVCSRDHRPLQRSVHENPTKMWNLTFKCTVEFLCVTCSVVREHNYNTFPAFQQDVLLFDYLQYTVFILIIISIMHFRHFPE